MAEITFKIVVITSSVAKITFAVTEITFIVAVITSLVVKITFVVAEITFKMSVMTYSVVNITFEKWLQRMLCCSLHVVFNRNKILYIQVKCLDIEF